MPKVFNIEGARERGEMQRKLFKNVLEFKEVLVHIDLSKEKMIKFSNHWRIEQIIFDTPVVKETFLQ